MQHRPLIWLCKKKSCLHLLHYFCAHLIVKLPSICIALRRGDLGSYESVWFDRVPSKSMCSIPSVDHDSWKITSPPVIAAFDKANGKCEWTTCWWADMCVRKCNEWNTLGGQQEATTFGAWLPVSECLSSTVASWTLQYQRMALQFRWSMNDTVLLTW